MKFVYFGYDFMLPAVYRLMEDGHALAGIFSFPCDNIFNFNARTVELGDRLGISVSLLKPQTEEIDSLVETGTELFLAAGYLYKIPPIDERRAYGMNVHPSYLPEGRGLMPTPSILMDHPGAAGITLHKLTQEYDAGDIMYQEKLPLRPDETVETYSARVAMRGPEIISKIVADLPLHWEQAKAQDHARASVFPMPDDRMRLFDWNAPVDRIKAVSRAFGSFGSLCRLDGQLFIVHDIDVWPEAHNLQPGAVAYADPRMHIVAARDGFVCLKNARPAGP